MFICQPLTPADLIEIAGIVTSLITSIVAIVISVKTLKQNSDMIEESTRPYIVIYSRTTNFQNPNFYLVLKNYGQTGATIISLECDHDLKSFSYSENHIPYSHIPDTFVAPGQSYICTLDTSKLFAKDEKLHFTIKYAANGKTYSDSFVINPSADSDLLQTRASTANKELRNISYTLQDLVEKLL